MDQSGQGEPGRDNLVAGHPGQRVEQSRLQGQDLRQLLKLTSVLPSPQGQILQQVHHAEQLGDRGQLLGPSLVFPEQGVSHYAFYHGVK